MEQKNEQRLEEKDGLAMNDGMIRELSRNNNTLSAKLAVRNCQYKIALEGLKVINEFGNISVAIKTIEAMLDCVPSDS